MNEHEQWTEQQYAEAWDRLDREEPIHWAEMERIDFEQYTRQNRLWKMVVGAWLLISLGVLVGIIILKLSR